MAEQDKIVKIYDISTIGIDKVVGDLQKINNLFLEISKNKKGTGSGTGKSSTATDTDETKKLVAEKEKLQKKLKEIQSDLSKENAILKEKIRNANADAKLQAQIASLQQGSLARLRKELIVLRSSWDIMGASAREALGGKQLFADINRIDAEVKKLEQSTGRFQRNVGNYPGFKNLEQQGKDAVDKIDKGFTGLWRNIVAGAASFIGVQSIFSFLEKAIDKFEGAEVSVARFENAIKNLGGTEADILKINTAIDELTNKFSFLGKGELRDASTRLVTYGKLNAKQITDLLPTIVEFSANARISVDEATQAVIKGMEGSARALRMYGINVKDAKTEEERFALIHDELTKRVQGSAQIFGDSAAGKIAEYKKNLGILQKGIGEQLMPVYKDFLSLSVTFIKALKAVDFGNIIKGITALAGLWVAYRTYLIASNVAQIVSNSLLFANTTITTGNTVAKSVAILTEQARAAAIAEGTTAEVAQGIVIKGNTILTYLMIGAKRLWAIVTRALTYEFTLFNTAVKISPLGLFLTVVGTAVLLFSTLSTKANALTGSMKLSAEAQKDYNNTIDEGTKAAGHEISALDNLYKATQDSKKSKKELRQAAIDLQETYPKTFSNFTIEEILAGKAATAYNGLRDAILAASRAKALGAKLDEFAGEDLVNEKAVADAKAKLESAKAHSTKSLNDNFSNVGKSTHDFDPAYSAISRAQSQESDAQSELDNALKAQAETKKKYEYYLSEKEKLEKQGAKAETANTGSSKLGTAGGTAKADDKDKPEKINQIDILKKEYEHKKKILEENKQDEEAYYNDLIALNNKYIGDRKGLDAKEKETQIEFNDELKLSTKETHAKIFEIKLKALEREKKLDEDAVAEKLKNKLNDVNASETDKAQAQIDADNELLKIKRDYEANVQAIEKLSHEKSKEELQKTGDEIKAIQTKITDDLLLKHKAEYADKMTAIDENYLKRVREIQAQLVQGLVNAKTSKAIELIKKKAEKELDKARIEQIDADLLALDRKLLGEKKYTDEVAKLNKEKFDIEEKWREESIKKEEEAQKKKEDFYKQQLQKAESLFEKYISQQFELKDQQIEKDYNANKDFLDADKEKRLAMAQSAAERQAIEEEYAAKQKELERQRNIEHLENQKKQLEVDTAVASMKAISAGFESGGIPGAIVAEAIVIAEYLLALQKINSQKFAEGGMVQPANLSNGKITVTPNVQALPNGDNVLAYVKPGEVILNQMQQKLLGGPKTFQSIGVPGFANGGYIGASVQPPIFQSYYQTNSSNSSSSNSQDIAEMKGIVYSLAKIIASESSKPVILDPNAVTTHQNKQSKKVNLATV